MPKWLTQEWLDMTVEMAKNQPVRPGATARLQYVITNAPDGGEIHYYWVVEDGILKEAKLGDLEGAEITLTMTYEDHLSIAKSLLDPNTAFIQGRIKVTGNMPKLMSLLPITNSPEYKQLMKEIESKTEF
jgi:putative sterol carrier protein